jgi:hypothetical protein
MICGDLSDDFRQPAATAYQDIIQRCPNIYMTEIMMTDDKFFHVFLYDRARILGIQK